jgi:hypothetical protein
MRFHGLEKSSYIKYLEELDRIKYVRAYLILDGWDRFGPPTKRLGLKLDSIGDLKRLERLKRRLPKVSSWAELLDESS